MLRPIIPEEFPDGPDGSETSPAEAEACPIGFDAMDIEYDEEKRALTLAHRALDFAHANKVFEGMTTTVEDDRIDYGETRYQTVGVLDGRVVMVVWTPRDKARRIISMRECNVGERDAYQRALG